MNLRTLGIHSLLIMKRLGIGLLVLSGMACEMKEGADTQPPAYVAPAIDTTPIPPPPEPDTFVPPPILAHTPAANPIPIIWEELEPGLAFTEAEASIRANIGDSRVTLLRIDPAHFDFQLVSAKAGDRLPRFAPDWAAKEGLIAVVNAGMYQSDHLTNVGYMKNYDFVNQSRFNKDKAFIAFHPSTESLPPFQLIDRECHDWEKLVEDYQSVSQSIRMIDCNRRNKWGRQQRYWSMVVLCTDNKGRVLFAFTRSPYSVHDFIRILLKFPIGIQQAIYLEGGPEASFYLNHPQKTVAKMGSYETGFFEDDSNDDFWRIPNVIGVRRKKK